MAHNLVERVFREISEPWIKRSAPTRVADLEQAIHDYLDRQNENPKPFVWHMSADAILAPAARAAAEIL